MGAFKRDFGYDIVQEVFIANSPDESRFDRLLNQQNFFINSKLASGQKVFLR